MNTKFDELLEFPKFPFKVLGVADPPCPTWWWKCCSNMPRHHSPTVQPSSKGNYHSVRVTVTAHSKEHIGSHVHRPWQDQAGSLRPVSCSLAPPPGD